jgi:hypothetical protein
VRARLATAAIPALAWPAVAAADHGAARSPGNPVVEALIWAGAAFLIGVAIVAIVTVLARRKTPSE